MPRSSSFRGGSVRQAPELGEQRFAVRVGVVRPERKIRWGVGASLGSVYRVYVHGTPGFNLSRRGFVDRRRGVQVEHARRPAAVASSRDRPPTTPPGLRESFQGGFRRAGFLQPPTPLLDLPDRGRAALAGEPLLQPPTVPVV